MLPDKNSVKNLGLPTSESVQGTTHALQVPSDKLSAPDKKVNSKSQVGTIVKQVNNPLHGLTLEKIVTDLVDYYGWQELGQLIRIKCFIDTPSINSSLRFLRKTPWAREKVESLYLYTLREHNRSQMRARGLRV